VFSSATELGDDGRPSVPDGFLQKLNKYIFIKQDCISIFNWNNFLS